MIKALQITQLVLAFLVMGAIILQQRGTGLGGAFGSDSMAYRSRRGIEKLLYNSTVVLGIIFVILALLNLFLVLRT